ncbi:hypothetical protein Mal4_40590 [Maioricimonas rarisocia]|uniref:Uncharacterized protein n=1 Tax=Maioricimonas rarisocia TaxID=2528026 RepID=A0A517ZB38_9PLAN|nr:hypothetical protein [Maioricimonas rarisocia]QDU39713.1 hypothetical protein Mal4_40590 [Maioricimonas rarisocia]
MDSSDRDLTSDRWWIVALCAAIVGTGLIILLWSFPTSKWVGIPAGFILLFVVVLYFNPRFRYWRRANVCFGTAGILAFVPTIIARANLEKIVAFKFVSESSPLVVLGFLGAGSYLSWLDSRQQVSSSARDGVTSTTTNVQLSNSPNAVTGLTAGGDIIVNQGISEDMLLTVLDAQRDAAHIPTSSAVEPREVDEELVWRLIDDLKDARRRLEREDAARLLATLQNSFDRSGRYWPNVLRTEALLLMAEEERTKVSESRVAGQQVDLTRLQELLRELRDV